MPGDKNKIYVGIKNSVFCIQFKKWEKAIIFLFLKSIFKSMLKSTSFCLNNICKSDAVSNKTEN